MATVKVLIDGVGIYKAGGIVNDAPEGLIEIAQKGICNAATGELVAEIVDDAKKKVKEKSTEETV